MNAEPLMPADILTYLRILISAPRRRCRGAACPGASGTWTCSGRPPQTPAELHPGARIRGGDRPASASRPGVADCDPGDSAARLASPGAGQRAVQAFGQNWSWYLSWRALKISPRPPHARQAWAKPSLIDRMAQTGKRVAEFCGQSAAPLKPRGLGRARCPLLLTQPLGCGPVEAASGRSALRRAYSAIRNLDIP